jgi:hypothetical protein
VIGRMTGSTFGAFQEGPFYSDFGCWRGLGRRGRFTGQKQPL